MADTEPAQQPQTYAKPPNSGGGAARWVMLLSPFLALTAIGIAAWAMVMLLTCRPPLLPDPVGHQTSIDCHLAQIYYTMVPPILWY